MVFSILLVCRFAIRNANFEAEIISEDVAFSPTTIIDFTLSSSKKKSSLGTEEEPTLIGSIKENKIIKTNIRLFFICTPNSIPYFFFICLLYM